MTEEEAKIVSAFTGILLCNFSDLQKYAEEKLDRPLMTHQFANEELWEELKEESKEDLKEILEFDIPENW